MKSSTAFWCRKWRRFVITPPPRRAFLITSTRCRQFFFGAKNQRKVNGFAEALQNSGYATDANYAQKLINLAQSPLMSQVLMRPVSESDSLVIQSDFNEVAPNTAPCADGA